MSRVSILLTAVLTIALAAQTKATVLTGPISDLPEGQTFYWGDGTHDLYQAWSTNIPDSTGWIYAYSSVHFYIYPGLMNPRTISNATIFPYVTSGAMVASEGDTVFFRGTNGFCGAWRLDDFYPSAYPIDEGPYEGNPPFSYLNGRWYFQDNGSGNFVPEPSALMLLLIGGLAALKWRAPGHSKTEGAPLASALHIRRPPAPQLAN